MKRLDSRIAKPEHTQGSQHDTCVPLDIVDSMGNLAEEAANLTAAIECARIAALSSLADSTDYMAGTLTVLLHASVLVRSQANEMLVQLEGSLKS